MSELLEGRGDPDIHIILLPPTNSLEISALQRASTITLQKSIREGFGLTASETWWRKKPVIGSAVGGIPAQLIPNLTKDHPSLNSTFKRQTF